MDTTQDKLLKQHIDCYFGEKPDEVIQNHSTGVYVATFKNIPDDGLATFISIGLSAHLLNQKSGQTIRQESLMTVDSTYANLAVENVVLMIVYLILEKYNAVH